MAEFYHKKKRICQMCAGKTVDYKDVEDGKIQEVEVMGGCSGNLQGISKLLVGMPVEDAIGRLRGIKCGFKSTSCPDQLSKALEMFLEN